MAKTSTPQKKESTPRSIVENLESSFRIIALGGVTSCNNQIININQEIEECITEGVNKERQVYTGCDKAKREQEGAEVLVPSSRRLFEPLNSLV